MADVAKERLSRRGGRHLLRITLVLLLYAAVAAWCTHSFMERWGFREESRRTGLTLMLGHSAHRPFVFRVLVPFIVNGIARAVPEPMQDRLVAYALVVNVPLLVALSWRDEMRNFSLVFIPLYLACVHSASVIYRPSPGTRDHS